MRRIHLSVVVCGLWGMLWLALPSFGQEGEEAMLVPADAEGAQAALQDSPRHGEWVDIEVPGEQTPLRTWVVYPERSEMAPVVLVVHEIYGMTDWVRAVADQLAAAGFVAVAPDLLSGKGTGGGGTEAFEGDAVRSAIRGLKDEQVMARLDAARVWALALTSTSDRGGCIGFCWGGSTTFKYATHQPELDAAVVYYGAAPTDPEALAKINSPVLGLYGGDDARVTSTVEATTEAMRQAGKSYETHVYDGAGHGFLRQQTRMQGSNLAAATDAWAQTLQFLSKHLEAE